MSKWGTLVDYATREPIEPATEWHVIQWLNAHNLMHAENGDLGAFVIAPDGRRAASNLPHEGRLVRKVTVIDPPDGLDTTHPGSVENLRLMTRIREAPE